MESLFGKPRWAIFNSRTGEVTVVEHMPFEIGADENADLRLAGSGVLPKHCVINNPREEGVAILRRDPNARVLVNGKSAEQTPLKPGFDYKLELGSETLVLHGAEKIEDWAEARRAEFDRNPIAAVTSKPASATFRAGDWSLIDCQTGEITRVENLPFEIGSADDVNLRIEGLFPNHCAFDSLLGKGVWLVRRDSDALALLNGAPLESEELKVDVDYTLQLGPFLFLLRGGRAVRKWEENLNLGEWFIFDPEKGFTEGPFPYLIDVLVMARKPDFSDDAVAFPGGMGMGFYLRQLRMIEIENVTDEPASSLPPQGSEDDLTAT